jgi:F-type H+-transporting ATPase subunit b
MFDFLDNPTIVVGISFVLFIILIIYLKVPGKIAASLDEKSTKIKAEIDEARKLKEDAQAILAQFQRKQQNAKKETEDMLAMAKEESEIFAKEAEENFKILSARQTKAAEEKIAIMEANAVKEIQATAASVAINAAGQILGDVMDKKALSKLTDNSIDDLEKRLN